MGAFMCQLAPAGEWRGAPRQMGFSPLDIIQLNQAHILLMTPE